MKYSVSSLYYERRCPLGFRCKKATTASVQMLSVLAVQTVYGLVNLAPSAPPGGRQQYIHVNKRMRIPCRGSSISYTCAPTALQELLTANQQPNVALLCGATSMPTLSGTKSSTCNVQWSTSPSTIWEHKHISYIIINRFTSHRRTP